MSEGASVWIKKISITSDPVKRKELYDKLFEFGHLTQEEYGKRLKEDPVLKGKYSP